MVLDHYKLKVSETTLSYEFMSIGNKGAFLKAIQFTPIKEGLFYNLAFGDKNIITGEIDDEAITDNSDSEKVLATVIVAVYDFFRLFPNVWIYATGSTKSRTRLYRMGINKYYEIANKDFLLLGQTNDEWEPFEKGKNYDAFLSRRKSVNLSYE